jgi:hypothetical protein
MVQLQRRLAQTSPQKKELVARNRESLKAKTKGNNQRWVRTSPPVNLKRVRMLRGRSMSVKTPSTSLSRQFMLVTHLMIFRHLQMTQLKSLMPHKKISIDLRTRKEMRWTMIGSQNKILRMTPRRRQ